MVTDYRTGRSYVLFNYNKIDWWLYQTSAQGYRVTTYYKRLYTSYNYWLSYQLPSLTGNTGKTVELNKTLCHFENVLRMQTLYFDHDRAINFYHIIFVHFLKITISFSFFSVLALRNLETIFKVTTTVFIYNSV